MKKLFLIALLIFTNLSVCSQNNTVAKTLLDEVAQKVEGYDNIYIEFHHKFDNTEAEVHQETKGNVTLKGDLYHLNYMGTEQLFDGKKIYLIFMKMKKLLFKNPQLMMRKLLRLPKCFHFIKAGLRMQWMN